MESKRYWEQQDILEKEDTRRNTVNFRLQNERSVKLMRQADGLKAGQSYLQLLEENELRLRTCKLCGLTCETYFNMAKKHMNSKHCKERQAKSRGEQYVDPADCDVVCECGITVKQKYMKKHKTSQAHIRATTENYDLVCIPCNYQPKPSKQARKSFKRHLLGTRHIKKCVTPSQKAIHNKQCKWFNVKNAHEFCIPSSRIVTV